MRQTTIEKKTFDEERALYHLQDALVQGCTFAGPADGESALKEAHHVKVVDCEFSLRYPFWHTEDFEVVNTSMDDKTRAAIWYAKRGVIRDSRLNGIKCLRECEDIQVISSEIHSPECGWKCRTISFQNTEAESEYFLFESRDVTIDHVKMKASCIL